MTPPQQNGLKHPGDVWAARVEAATRALLAPDAVADAYREEFT